MPESVERFGKTTRWFHWTFASLFVLLAATGALLMLRRWLGLGEEAVGRIVGLHKVLALDLLLVPPLVWLSGETRKSLGDFREVGRWSRDDLRWLARQPRALFGTVELPPAGKLNAGQKLNAIVTGGVSLGLAVSGFMLWREPAALAPWWTHAGIFLSWLPLFGGHLFLALMHPKTRSALRGMTIGRVDEAWARHHHPAWIGLPLTSGTNASATERSRTRGPQRPRGARRASPDPTVEAVVEQASSLVDGGA